MSDSVWKQNAAGGNVRSLGVILARRRLQRDLEMQGKTNRIAEIGLVASRHVRVPNTDTTERLARKRKLLKYHQQSHYCNMKLF